MFRAFLTYGKAFVEDEVSLIAFGRDGVEGAVVHVEEIRDGDVEVDGDGEIVFANCLSGDL